MAESIDLVFVSNNISNHLWQMTANAIRTAIKHAEMPVGTVVTIEQCRHARTQLQGRTLHYNFPFNYNRCLNLGKSVCESQYIAFCNNDLYFETRWAKNAVKAMKQHDILSASPNPRRQEFPGIREGYRIGKEVLGWCIITDRRVFDMIGDFDTPVRFWYSDDVYALQLRFAGIKHALVGNSRVRHLKSVTLQRSPSNVRKEFMNRQRALFDEYKKQKYAIANLKIQTEAGHSD